MRPFRWRTERDARKSTSPQRDRVLEQTLERIELRLAALEERLEDQRRVLRQLPAVVRKLYLDGVSLPPEFELRARRFGLGSQNEEDGILLELFRRIGTTDRRFVEIGCGVNGGNTGFLAADCGWSGLMVDARKGAVEKSAAKFASERVTVIKRRVTRESLDGMLKKFGFVGSIDLLSIDVDGIDYWLWDGLTACQPRVVIIEFNWLWGAERAVTVPYDPDFDISKGGTRAYRGASLNALVRLGDRVGYRLVATERVNAIFVQAGLALEFPTLSPAQAIRAPTNLSKAMDPFGKIAAHGLALVEVPEGGPARGTER